MAFLFCNAVLSISSGTAFCQGSDHQPSTLNPQPLLAALPSPDPAHFTNWLVSAAAALSLAALGKSFLRKTPLETQFLTRKEFTEFRDKLDQDLAAISSKIDRSFDLLSHHLDSLNQRMDEVRSLVDRADERTKTTRPISRP